MVRCELPQSWWFDSHSNTSKQSPWLASTLSALQEMTKQTLQLIEQDADSFAQRAEMYYKKRPLLVNMIGDLYRAHRSLAEQHDLLKSAAAVARHGLLAAAPSLPPKTGGSAPGRTSDCDESESEVDDPEEEPPAGAGDGELMREEIERLTARIAALEREVAAKDEEKREVIRQLSSAIDLLKEENAVLRRRAGGSSRSAGRQFDIKKLAAGLLAFSGNVFGGGGGAPRTTVVPL